MHWWDAITFFFYLYKRQVPLFLFYSCFPFLLLESDFSCGLTSKDNSLFAVFVCALVILVSFAAIFTWCSVGGVERCEFGNFISCGTSDVTMLAVYAWLVSASRGSIAKGFGSNTLSKMKVARPRSLSFVKWNWKMCCLPMSEIKFGGSWYGFLSSSYSTIWLHSVVRLSDWGLKHVNVMVPVPSSCYRDLFNNLVYHGLLGLIEEIVAS